MWCEVDMTDVQEAKEVYDLLNQNYVEDDDNMFRFDYSPAFLEWALSPPGNAKEFVVGIRVAPTAAALAKGKGRGKLVGFITGVPVQMRVYDKIMPMVEINFLCVLKKLRSKRLAPVLIKEITRRVNLTGVSAYFVRLALVRFGKRHFYPWEAMKTVGQYNAMDKDCYPKFACSNL